MRGADGPAHVERTGVDPGVRARTGVRHGIDGIPENRVVWAGRWAGPMTVALMCAGPGGPGRPHAEPGHAEGPDHMVRAFHDLSVAPTGFEPVLPP